MFQVYNKATRRYTGEGYVTINPQIRKHHQQYSQGIVETDTDIVEGRTPPTPPNTEPTIIYKKVGDIGKLGDIIGDIEDEILKFGRWGRLIVIGELLNQGGITYQNLTNDDKGVILSYVEYGTISEITGLTNPMVKGRNVYDVLGWETPTSINEVINEHIVKSTAFVDGVFILSDIIVTK